MWGLKNETHLFSLIPLLTHLSSAGQRGSEKAGTDWTCRKLTPPCEPTATCKWAQHSWCRDPGEQTRERTGFIPAFVAGRGTSSRPQSGLSSNTWEWVVRGDTCVDKPRDFIEKGGLGGEQQGKRTQEDSSALCLRFLVMRLVSRLSLVSHSDSGPLLVVHTVLSQGGCQRGF